MDMRKVCFGICQQKTETTFEKLIKALSKRFLPKSQTELYRAQLKEMQWKHCENIPKFGQRIFEAHHSCIPWC